MAIAGASFAYPNISSEKRAELATRLLDERTNCNALVLNTCLRLEVLVEGDVDALGYALSTLFDESPDMAAAAVRCDSEAVIHLFRVVAGLESPIIGEQEILLQSRVAIEQFHESGQPSGLFWRLLQESIAIGRQARDLLPESPHASLAAVAAQTVGRAERVAVLGSGAMSSAVVSAVADLPAPPPITVVARTPDRVTATGVEVWTFDKAAVVLRDFPAIISATSSRHHPVADLEVQQALDDRRSSGVLIDMAMPPDFRIPAGSDLAYIDIDDLARMAGRRTRMDNADDMVESAAVCAYRRFTTHGQVGPVISAMTISADIIVGEVAERFARRLGGDDDAAVLRHAVHNATRTLLAAPIGYVKSAGTTSDDIQAVASAFGVGIPDGE